MVEVELIWEKQSSPGSLSNVVEVDGTPMPTVKLSFMEWEFPGIRSLFRTYLVRFRLTEYWGWPALVNATLSRPAFTTLGRQIISMRATNLTGTRENYPGLRLRIRKRRSIQRKQLGTNTRCIASSRTQKKKSRSVPENVPYSSQFDPRHLCESLLDLDQWTCMNCSGGGFGPVRGRPAPRFGVGGVGECDSKDDGPSCR